MLPANELIEYYEQKLEKVLVAFPIGDNVTPFDRERNQEYIDNARNDLEAVKNEGRVW